MFVEKRNSLFSSHVLIIFVFKFFKSFIKETFRFFLCPVTKLVNYYYKIKSSFHFHICSFALVFLVFCFIYFVYSILFSCSLAFFLYSLRVLAKEEAETVNKFTFISHDSTITPCAIVLKIYFLEL